MTIKSKEKDFYIKEGLWAGRSLYNLYQEAHTPLSGMKNYLNVPQTRVLLYFLHLLMSQLLTY